MERGEDGGWVGEGTRPRLFLFIQQVMCPTRIRFSNLEWSLFTELGKKERILVIPVVVSALISYLL